MHGYELMAELGRLFGPRYRASPGSVYRARGVKRGFRIHLTFYVAVQILLVAVWALTGAGYPWFVYPFLGWGVGLAIHYAAIRDQLRGRSHE